MPWQTPSHGRHPGRPDRAIAASFGDFEEEPGSVDPAAGEEADQFLRIAAEWPVGTVLGRRRDVVYPVRPS